MDPAQALRQPHELGSVQEVEDVLNNTDNVLLLIYMPGCAWCERYFPTHQALAKLLHAGNTGVSVAQINGIEKEEGKLRRDLINERAGGNLSKGFPTILLKRQNGDLFLHGQSDKLLTPEQFLRAYPGAHPEQQADQSLTIREYGETKSVPVMEGHVLNIFQKEEQEKDSREQNSILVMMARFMNKPELYPIEEDLPKRASEQSTHVLHYAPPISGSLVPGALQGLVKDTDFPDNVDSEELTAVILGRLMVNPELAAKVAVHRDPEATDPCVRTAGGVQVVKGKDVLSWLDRERERDRER
jgi:hypothetical protein